MADSSVSLYKDRDCQPKPATVNIYIYEKIYFRFRPYKRIPSFTWKYFIETTCVVKQTDGGPDVADLAVFFSKSLNQLLNKIKSK